MTEDAPNWVPLLEAARRKVRIATFHFEHLEDYLQHPPQSKDVPIPIQAHFEGVIVSAMAAVDQVAQAINSALGLGAENPGQLVERAFSAVSSLPGVDQWYRDPIGRDLRSIRTRIVHYSYTKDLRGVQFAVEEASRPYPGPRDLAAYSREALAYADKLSQLIPSIQGRLQQRDDECTD